MAFTQVLELLAFLRIFCQLHVVLTTLRHNVLYCMSPTLS